MVAMYRNHHHFNELSEYSGLLGFLIKATQAHGHTLKWNIFLECVSELLSDSIHRIYIPNPISNPQYWIQQSHPSNTATIFFTLLIFLLFNYGATYNFHRQTFTYQHRHQMGTLYRRVPLFYLWGCVVHVFWTTLHLVKRPNCFRIYRTWLNLNFKVFLLIKLACGLTLLGHND